MIAHAGEIAQAVKARMVTLPALAATWNDANVYIVEEDRWDGGMESHQEVAQVSLLDLTYPDARSGGGLVTGAVRISVYHRSNVDRAFDSAERLAASGAAIALAQTVLGAMVHSFLQGILLSPLRPSANARPSASPRPSGWSRVAVVLDFSAVLETYPTTAVLNDGETADCGQEPA